MKKINISFWIFLIGLTFLWTLANNLPSMMNYFSIRTLVNQYTGVISIGAMSLSMLLATRMSFIEKMLGGLDKNYRLHKWLGIIALVSALTHFWFTKGTKWMIGWGWIARPVRQARPPQLEQSAAFNLESWFRSFRGIAEFMGEWAFYIIVILIVVALIKRIPYHWFKFSHQFISVVYLALVFHSIILIDFSYWRQPIGWVMFILLLIGTLSSLFVLFRGIGKRQKTSSIIENITHSSADNYYELVIHADKWQGHRAGQFAFIANKTCNKEPHPFTIASYWHKNGKLRFLIKELGDYTSQLANYFKQRDQLEIEGPYGCFNFDDKKQKQIWIATGIGITPFIARLEELGKYPYSQKIDLFYCYSGQNKVLITELETKSQDANVNLFLWNSSEKGRLTTKQMIDLVNDIHQASIWFCGNNQMAKQMQSDLNDLGIADVAFHQELFEMR